MKPQPLFDTYQAFRALVEQPGLPDGVVGGEESYIAERPSIDAYLESMRPEVRARADFAHVCDFLESYSRVETTFRSYRTQVERLMLWSWIKAGKSLLDLTRSDAEKFILFCESPDSDWVSNSARKRFTSKDGLIVPNPLWRPFAHVATKEDRKLVQEGQLDDAAGVALSNSSLRQAFVICASFYDHLASNHTDVGNPFRAIKQKSQLFERSTEIRTTKALTKLQWDFVLETAELMSTEDPYRHERTLFILVTLFSMYLRISDLVGNQRWEPKMNSFRREGNNWWFYVNGKGNKLARVSVRTKYLAYLMRYRRSRSLSPLPSASDDSPLLVSLSGKPGLTDRHVREIVQQVFDRALARMQEQGFEETELDSLRRVSLHWLRHTSATFDAKHRDMKHLQSDLRHDRLSTTSDIYYNTHDEERAQSAANLDIAVR